MKKKEPTIKKEVCTYCHHDKASHCFMECTVTKRVDDTMFKCMCTRFR